MTIRPLALVEAEYIAHALAVELMNSDSEPIPPFNTRYPGKLESSLAQPFQTFDGKFLYRTFAEKAAVLFYLITKNHCFTNGNKRMAVTLTTLFFFVNKRWIDVTPLGLYEIARVVAESRPEQRDTVHTILLVFFRDHQVALN